MLTLGLLAAAGALGGFVSGLRSVNHNLLQLPGGRKVELGFLGDILLGATTSLATFFLAWELFDLKDDEGTPQKTLFRIIAIGILGGFAGIRLLTAMSEQVVKRLTNVQKQVEDLEQRERSHEALSRASELLAQKRYDQALAAFDGALSLNPDSETAMIGKAKVLRWLGRVKDAIALLDRLLETRQVARAYYNRSCYHALQGETEAALSDLAAAIKLDRFYVDYAPSDQDFNELRKDSRFASIIGLPEHLRLSA